jgi:hypothetical protein
MASGVDLARVFRLATTLCERGNVVATTAEVCEGVNVGQPVAGDAVVEQPLISMWIVLSRQRQLKLMYYQLDQPLIMRGLHLVYVCWTIGVVFSGW